MLLCLLVTLSGHRDSKWNTSGFSEHLWEHCFSIFHSAIAGAATNPTSHFTSKAQKRERIGRVELVMMLRPGMYDWPYTSTSLAATNRIHTTSGVRVIYRGVDRK